MNRLFWGMAIAAAAAAGIIVPARSETPMTPLRGGSDAAVVANGQRPGRHDSDRRATGAVKPGRWEFTSRLNVSAKGARPLDLQLAAPAQAATGGMKSSYTVCVESDNAVPAQIGPQCKLDRRTQEGARITWSMTCAATHVHADGVARYNGDRMEATMVSRLRGGAGAVAHMTQHITGRYLGPCADIAARAPPISPPFAAAAAASAAPAQPPAPKPAAAANNAPTSDGRPVATAAIPPAPAAAPHDSGAPRAPAAVPPPAGSGHPAEQAKPPPSEEQEAEPAVTENKRHKRHAEHRRYAHRRHRHYRHYRYRGYASVWSGRGAAFAGPAPYSDSGP